MTNEKLKEIKKIVVAGAFLLTHLLEHHGFSEEKAEAFVSKVATKLYNIKKREMEKMIKESFDTKK